MSGVSSGKSVWSVSCPCTRPGYILYADQALDMDTEQVTICKSWTGQLLPQLAIRLQATGVHEYTDDGAFSAVLLGLGVRQVLVVTGWREANWSLLSMRTMRTWAVLNLWWIWMLALLMMRSMPRCAGSAFSCAA